MTRMFMAAAMLPVLILSACGSDPAPGPVEQIVVREPGDAPAVQEKSPVPDSEDTNLAAGKAAYAACMACHVLEKGAANGAGPNLFGVLDQPAGAVEGFAYSDALKESGVNWTRAELDAYIANPSEKIPGTTMVAGAVEDADQRSAIIDYIETISNN